MKKRPPICKYYYVKNRYKNRYWNDLCKSRNKENWLTLLWMANKYSENWIDIDIDGIIGIFKKEKAKDYLNGKFYEGSRFNSIIAEGNMINIDRICN